MYTERTKKCGSVSLHQDFTGITKPGKMHSSNELRVTLLPFSIRHFISNTFTRYSQNT